MISFAAAYLHDNSAFLLFYLDGSSVRRVISGYFKNYNFKIKDEWTIINYLHLTNIVITLFISLLNFFSSVISKILSIWDDFLFFLISHSEATKLDPTAA
jgi:hypothetical protein